MACRQLLQNFGDRERDGGGSAAMSGKGLTAGEGNTAILFGAGACDGSMQLSDELETLRRRISNSACQAIH